MRALELNIQTFKFKSKFKFKFKYSSQLHGSKFGGRVNKQQQI